MKYLIILFIKQFGANNIMSIYVLPTNLKVTSQNNAYELKKK